MTFFKIVDVINGDIKTLYHGNNKCRKLQPNKWLKSEQKFVTDGNRKSGYISGWHLFLDYDECLKYLKYFKKLEYKRIVKCQAKDTWKKPYSRGDIVLAKEIFIEEFV